MGHRYARIAFTDAVRAVQAEMGSLQPQDDDEGDDHHHRLGPIEAGFIAARDSLYMATVNADGWPYVQHRGGPTGFVRVLDEGLIGFADFRGNRQYVSVGNLREDDRVALFFMDYAQRTRLKLFGRVSVVPPDDLETLARLEVPDYRAPVERGFLIRVEAFDWNCPQHITPRFTAAEMAARLAPLQARVAELEAASMVPRRTDRGDGPLPLVVTGVRQLTPRIQAFELRSVDRLPLPAVAAGAHLGVPIDDAGGLRAYSICSNPARRDIYEIAVLREADGRGGSRAMHDTVALGSVLHCQPPANHFPLHADKRPAVLIAGGVGITPLKAMAQTLLARGAPFHLHYAGRSRAEMAFADRLERALGAALTLYPADEGRRLDIVAVLRAAPADALIYLCGPERLIDAARDAAAFLGIDAARLRIERFAAVPACDDRPVRLTLARSGRRVDVPATRSLLDGLLEAGVAVPSSCRAGVCRTCAVRVLDGAPDHRDTVLSADERDTRGLMCPCVSRALGPTLTLDL
ncbi:MAG: pyridoxamine 5'-phosphate oxidase family protein [Rhodocyclaceae bacterium]|nr:pyridoxamine 5'-phosphate oxidase family protein [Rhodocyclaceae bacterium]